MSFPWLKNYPADVPHNIKVDTFHSLGDMLESAMKEYKNNTAFSYMGQSYSFQQIDEDSRNFAAFLQNHLQLRKGDVIAIQMPNTVQYPIALYGALRAGLIVTNINPLYTARELQHQLNDSGAVCILALANFADKLQEVYQNTKLKHLIITELGDHLSWPKSKIVNLVVKHIKKMIPSYSLPEAYTFKDALARGHQLGFRRFKVNPSDTAFLQYTGGTTGVSKGAELTHANIIANINQTLAWIGGKLQKGHEIALCPLPLYHIFSLTVNCLGLFCFGAKNVLITNPRDLKAFIEEMQKHNFSIFTGLNTLFNGLMNHPDFSKVNFKHLKVCVGGGMAMQKVVSERWYQLTSCKVLEGYGLTETSPLLCCNPLDGKDRVTYIGMPVSNTEVKIVDDNGQEVAYGQSGEIWGRGPQIMKGYYRRPEETAKSLTEDGWFKTGDIGIMEADGFIKIVDRKKDMILVSGFNVYPNEIEEVLSQHPKILESAVVGVADEKSTEVVKAFIVARDPSLSKEEVLEHCHKYLTNYKIPKYIDFRKELPKSNVGKVLRRLLRDEK